VSHCRRLSPLLLVGALALAAACSSTETDVSRERFRDDFQARANAGLGKDEPENVTDEVADCFTDAVFRDFEQPDINEIYRALDEDDLGEDRRDQLFEINQRCFTEAAAADEGTEEPEGEGG